MELEDIVVTPNGASLTLRLRLRNGLHARPAAKLAREAQRYKSNICISSEAGEADAKSMLDILALALPTDTKLTIRATGTDAREAVAAVATYLDEAGD